VKRSRIRKKCKNISEYYSKLPMLKKIIVCDRRQMTKKSLFPSKVKIRSTKGSKFPQNARTYSKCNTNEEKRINTF